jgi:hypothetical protein
LFGVGANDGDDLVLEFDRGIGLGAKPARRRGWRLSTTILRGLLILAGLPLGIGGEAWVRLGVDMAVLWSRRCDEIQKSPTEGDDGLLVA